MEINKIIGHQTGQGQVFANLAGQENWNIFLTQNLASIQDILGTKAKEYMRKDVDNRLYNFEVNARRLGISVSKMVHVLALKNMLGAEMIVEALGYGDMHASGVHDANFNSLVDEKFGDTINYFLLMKFAVLYDAELIKQGKQWWGFK